MTPIALDGRIHPDVEEIRPPRRTPRRAAVTLLMMATWAVAILTLAPQLGMTDREHRREVVPLTEGLPLPSGGSRAGFPEDGPAVRVSAYEYGFQPSREIVTAGQVVFWQNTGDDFHLVTPSTPATREVFERALERGSSRHVFDRPGVYDYHCAIHKQMRGTVVVRPS